MKKTVVILLSCFILLQSGILSLQLVVKLLQHKMTIENRLEKGLLDKHLVSFSSSELVGAVWENDHEFFIDKDKYDVVKRVKNGDETSYSCINDNLENKLINDLQKSEKKSNLIENLLKKINLQLFNGFTVEWMGDLIKSHVVTGHTESLYSFIFKGFLNKPPIL